MKEIFDTISKKEWQFVLLMSVVMILMTSLPYLLGYLMVGEDMVYNGLHAITAGDIPVYYSYISQVKSGEFFVKNLFTPEPQEIGTFNAWWIIVGLGARIFNLSPILAFHLFRILMVPVFIFSVYIFISYYFEEKLRRKICLIFLLFSSGLGAYFSPFFRLFSYWEDAIPYRWPLDLWWSEATTFTTLYQTSHFVISITLTIWIFLLMIIAFSKKRFSYVILCGFLTLFYFNFHPYYLPVIFGVLGLYLFTRIIKAQKILWPQVGYLLTVFLISIPSIIYHFWLIQKSPVIGQRALQNVTLSSGPLFVAIGYGFLLPGFLLGLFYLLKNKRWSHKFTFLVLWFINNLVLLYLPFPFQSRYTQGIHVILTIFTTIGLFEMYNYLKEKIKPTTFDFWINNQALWLIFFIIFFTGSTIFNIGRDIYYFSQKPEDVAMVFYLPKDVVEAMNWLKAQPKPQTVLAADITAKFTPSISGQSVYFGHPQETLFPYAKAMYLVWFFKQDDNDEAKKRFLIGQKIDFVFYSDYEKKLGEFNPREKDYLELVFDLPKAKVYRVIKE